MSASIYGLVRTVHQPTAVDACCSCRFFSNDEENLVVATSNWLKVYRVISEEISNSDAQGGSLLTKQKLECLASFHLFGNIISVSSLRLPWNPRDVLLLSFKDAKLSVLEYDPHTRDLVTLSLHFFEEDELKSGVFSNFKKPVVRVDPDLRCAVMLVYGCQLVVLPLKKDVGDASSSSKTPFAPSYIIDLSKMEEKIHNINDIQFLQGYYEPTLFILYEPIRTWAGRLPIRKDTCKIAAISLNMQERAHPVIWSMDNLPFDCRKALAVPNGGVLVFAATSVIYLNQSVPPYAASVSSLSDVTSSHIPMKPQESIALTLDNSHCCMISSDQVVMSTKTGEIYVMTLCLDSMRAVSKLHFDKAASSVLPSCVCMVGDGFLFLGSRLGNSLLLKYTSSDDGPADNSNTAAVPADKLQIESAAAEDWLAKDAASLENELDELEVYGTELEKDGEEKITQYTFQVCDSLMNIAPCGRITLGEPAFLSEELLPLCQVDLDLELVTTSGYGKNGALTFLQRTVRPQIVTTFQLPDIRDVWTVRGPLNSETIDENQKDCLESDMHSYLILGKDDSTMILQTTDDISELDHSGFNTQTYTVFAGNIGENYTIQVTAKGVRLLYGVKQLQNIPVELGSPVCLATVCDPYVLVVSEAGAVMLLQLKTTDEEEARLTVLRQPSDDLDIVAVTACLYRDVSGAFTFPSHTLAEEEADTSDTVRPVVAPRLSRLSVSLDDSKTGDTSQEDLDEDELLYGDSDMNVSFPVVSSSDGPAITTNAVDSNVTQPTNDSNRVPNVILCKEHSATYWVFITTKENGLQIFSVPDLKLAYSTKNFNSGYKVVFDSDNAKDEEESDMKAVPASLSTIKELLVTGLGTKKHKTYIFARTTTDMLLVYEAFPYTEHTQKDRLQLRFKRFNHNLIVRERKRVAKKRQADGSTTATDTPKYSKQLLRPFENIGGYSGVFLAGPYPHWFIISSKGEMRCHPMGIDNGIICMSNFHNINCPRGFLYFNRQGELRISILPAHLTYEHQWPSRKVPLKTTAHFVRYDPDSKVYVIVCSQTELCKKLVKIESDEKQFLEMDKDDRFVFPTQQRYYIQLLSPINCDFIPGTRVDTEEGEAITSVEIVSLSQQEQENRNYIAVGTNTSFNEEVTSKGRIMLYEVIEVVPEPGQPLTKNKLKEIYAKEQKGPVTALSHVEGMLLAAVGQKIYVFELKHNDLFGASFVDSQIYVHQMVSIKNLVLIADIQMSVSVMRYQPAYRVLSLVSRDMKPMEVYGTEFVVDNNNLGFVATDRDQNLSVYMYQYDSPHSSGGSILMRKADMNLGTCVNSLCRVRCKLNDPSTCKQFPVVVEKKHVTYFASVDGSVGYLLPLTERVYRRMDMTQKILYTTIQHTAGLNPNTYRSIRTQNRMLQNAQHNLIDGDLVWKFLGLTQVEQAAVAKRMGTTPDQIIEDLLEIDRVTTHF